ncbi:GNAT family N-acetyltransferase [Microbacterium sp. PM5]|uniref:GNAT family N-acetyltransferase n=1 Tax=Microbacterium sp. PM5 TaxID=2014534 RepID=UPI001EF7D932|nr:GNAT family N-acetyltransferase [Microbacterium sp. PM5]
MNVADGAAAPLVLEPCGADAVADLTAFLREVDLTLSGLDEPDVRLWIERDAEGRIVGSTGYELNAAGDAVLVRSVAVHPRQRAAGRGTALARFALARAADEGATTAWLFSRRSGGFWQTLGFAPADRDELAALFAETHQVRMFQESGRLSIEVAWSMPLA